MNETIKWTNLSQEEIAKRLAEKGHKISVSYQREYLS